eukprot:scaffold267688_cov25-Prasinocladus_malaysianus.AAC.2
MQISDDTSALPVGCPPRSVTSQLSLRLLPRYRSIASHDRRALTWRGDAYQLLCDHMNVTLRARGLIPWYSVSATEGVMITYYRGTPQCIRYPLLSKLKG